MVDEGDLAVAGLYAWSEAQWRRLEATRVAFEGPDGRKLTAEIDVSGMSPRVRVRASAPTSLASRQATILVHPGGGNDACVLPAVPGAGSADRSVPSPVAGPVVVRAGHAGDRLEATRLYASFGPDHGLLLAPREGPPWPGGWAVDLRAGLDPTEEDMARHAETRELRIATLSFYAEARDVLIVHASVARWTRGYKTMEEALEDAGPCRVPECGCENFHAADQGSLQAVVTCTCRHPLLAHLPQPTG